MARTEFYMATLEVTECPNCGVPFGVPQNLMTRLRENGATFYCPNGHPQLFGEYEVKRLRRQAKEAEARASRYKSRAIIAENRRRAAKGQLTKLKNKIARGECPCCHEHFPDLEAHMTSAHPDFSTEVTDAD